MSSIITKVYLYDSTKESDSYRGIDYSDYLLLGDTIRDNLDDTLDTMEITLADLPFREEFAPKTKFIIEKWQRQENADGTYTDELWNTYHYCVDNDTVEQPIMSDENCFLHRISLIEASVVAQGLPVDDISVTYKLQDVSLEEKPTYDSTSFATIEKTDARTDYYNFVNYHTTAGYQNEIAETRLGHDFIWEMPNYYQVEIDGKMVTPIWAYWESIRKNVAVAQNERKTLQLPLPMLACYHSIDGSFEKAKSGYCDIQVTVKKTRNGQSTTTTFSASPTTAYSQESTWVADAMTGGRLLTGFGWIISSCQFVSDAGLWKYAQKLSNVATLSTEQNPKRVIDIDLEIGCSYEITVSRKTSSKTSTFGSGYIGIYGNANDFGTQTNSYESQPSINSYCKTESPFTTGGTPPTHTEKYIVDGYPYVKISFNVVLKGETNETYLRSATIPTAYELIKKAQLCSQTYEKQAGVPTIDTPTAFYAENEDELKKTTIIESFYNRKNLWEVISEAYKYIHARPKIVFGADDRFKITAKKYGRTDIKEDLGVRASIYNSRFVGEYVSACSSYVTNMVQLGGTITEIVPAKSSSDDFLVYNDVAEIITEKPIIEIVDMSIINSSGVEHKIAGTSDFGTKQNGYIFEYNIYQTLSINKNTNVNKGKAIYYKLGENKIQGLTYQLPVVNTGDEQGEYAIKNIIAELFNISDVRNIKVNDYLFKITYRTNDTLRVNQTRPDLRKYLILSKYDRVPQHNQFNNQTDTMIDSNKFGQNIYGKLIRTGNKTYQTVEWNDNLFDLKNSGDLYTIDGELYYVSKAQHTNWGEYTTSNIEFSKDWNRLSPIIGIPSEPRFYEISEQSLIRREKPIDDYVLLTAEQQSQTTSYVKSYISSKGWEYIAEILLKPQSEYPRYAVTYFKDDKDGWNTANNGEPKTVKVLKPVCSYSIGQTLTISWDMVDNYSAGDQVLATSDTISTTTDKSYKTLFAYRYGNLFGRSDLIDFAILKDYQFATQGEIRNLPASPVDIVQNADSILFGNTTPTQYGTQGVGIVLVKDNREAISIDYNLQTITDSDRFVLSTYMWQQNKASDGDTLGGIYIALLKDEINKLSNNTIPQDDFYNDKSEPISFEYEIADGIHIKIEQAISQYANSVGVTLEELMQNIKAIAIYSTRVVNNAYNAGDYYFIFGRNIDGLTTSEKVADWYLSKVKNSLFKRQ